MRRKELTEQQWNTIAPLVPAQKSRRARPAKDHRTTLNAILWVLRSGAPWRDLPEHYGPWQTAASRFHRWLEKEASGRECSKSCKGRRIARERLSGRSTSSTAPAYERISAPPGQKGEPRLGPRMQLGRLRYEAACVKAEGFGEPLAFIITEGQRRESWAFEELMRLGKLKRDSLSGRASPQAQVFGGG
jgi:transposase